MSKWERITFFFRKNILVSFSRHHPRHQTICYKLVQLAFSLSLPLLFDSEFGSSSAIHTVNLDLKILGF